MSGQVNNNINNSSINLTNIINTISIYAGRLWKWLENVGHKITELFFSKKPPHNPPSTPPHPYSPRRKVNPINVDSPKINIDSPKGPPRANDINRVGEDKIKSDSPKVPKQPPGNANVAPPPAAVLPKIEEPKPPRTPEPMEPEIGYIPQARGARREPVQNEPNERPVPQLRMPELPPQIRMPELPPQKPVEPVLPPPLPVKELPSPTLADRLQNLTARAGFTQIRVMNQCLQVSNDAFSIGDESCSYQSFKNALVAIALANGANIPGDTFEDQDVYYYFYEFMKTYRKSEAPGFRDIPVSTMPQILEDFLKLKDTNFAQIENPLLRNKIIAIHTALTANSRSVGMFNVKDDYQLLLTDPTALKSLSVLKEASQKPGPCTYAFLTGAHGHWTTVIMEKNAKGIIKWYGCDSWPGSPASVLSLNIETLENTFNRMTSIMEHGYGEAMGADFKRLANCFEANGQAKLDAPSQNRIATMFGAGENYYEKANHAFQFIKEAGWLMAPNDKVKNFLKDLKVIVNFLGQYSPDQMIGTLTELNALNLN